MSVKPFLYSWVWLFYCLAVGANLQNENVLTLSEKSDGLMVKIFELILLMKIIMHFNSMQF